MADIIGSAINAILSAIDSIIGFIKGVIDAVIRQAIDTITSVLSTVWNAISQAVSKAVEWMVSVVKGMVVQPVWGMLTSALAFVQRKMFGTVYILLLAKLMQAQVVSFVEKPSLKKLAMIAAKPFILYIALAIGWQVMMGMLSQLGFTGTVTPSPIQVTPPGAPPPPTVPAAPPPTVVQGTASDSPFTAISVDVTTPAAQTLSDGAPIVIDLNVSQIEQAAPAPAPVVTGIDSPMTVISVEHVETARPLTPSDSPATVLSVDGTVLKSSSIQDKIQSSAVIGTESVIEVTDSPLTVIDVTGAAMYNPEGGSADFSSMPDFADMDLGCSNVSVSVYNGELVIGGTTTGECSSGLLLKSNLKQMLNQRRIALVACRARGESGSGNSHPWRFDGVSVDGRVVQSHYMCNAGQIRVATWSSSEGYIARDYVSASITDRAVAVCTSNESSKLVVHVALNASAGTVAAWSSKYSTRNSVDGSMLTYVGKGVSTTIKGYFDDFVYASPE